MFMKFVLPPLLAFTALACVAPPKASSSQLTQGNVQMYLQSGTTTKSEVLETFGAPNITTRDSSGLEMWVYERNAREARSNQAFATILLAGVGTSGFETSSKNMTLIIKFSADDIVRDFDSRYSSF
jgi:outer membrane protein assembly factor BamE (lipoprotein component of BamABCDE complex)